MGQNIFFKKNGKFYTYSHKFFQILPWLIILFSVSYILIMLVLSYLIDFKGMDVLGLGSWLKSMYSGYPIFWIYAFTEGSPTEHIQWYFIFTSVVLAAFCFIMRSRRYSKVYWTWLLMLIGLTLMFFEDYYNIRHKTVDFISSYYSIAPSTKFMFLHLRTAVELFLYTVLGIIMIIALIYILKDKRESLRGKKFLVMGYLFYAVASFSSATRGIGNWYARLGRAILGDNWIDMAALVTQRPYRGNLGFYFMDFVFEEPLELMGAAFITASLIYFVKYWKDN